MQYFLAILCALCPLFVLADNVKRPESYNYTRGLEAFQQNNIAEAKEYLGKAISEQPDNGYAYLWLGVVFYSEDVYSNAITCLYKAIKLIPICAMPGCECNGTRKIHP